MSSDETPLLGETLAVREVRQRLARIARSEAPVLLRGESGTGKEVAARLLHRWSPRAAAPFVRLNCAAIPAELLESELFGYEAGAFTGAARRKLGKFELAARGTLMLDEISEMQPGLQAKLLHILQDGEYSRLGAERSQTAQARVVAASNVALEAAVGAGRFRADLFYRLNVVVVRLPPLRERREDIPLLAEYFLRKHGAEGGWLALSVEVRQALLRHAWPGNVRELENLMRRLVILGDEAQALEDLRAELRAGPLEEGEKPAASGGVGSDARGSEESGLGLVAIGKRAAWEAERRAILAALEATRWNRRQAAQLLQVSYKALHNKLRAMNREAALSAPARRQPQRAALPPAQRAASA
ncbi:MAG: sigma-54 interaction domain-containing protein [Terriglobales bacterium]